MRGAPITVFNRYTGKPFEEAVYGEGLLRFAYESGAGRLLTRHLISRPFLSRLYGWFMDRPRSMRKVRPFIEQYGIDEAEFAQPVESFRTFNEFFTRILKPDARPVDPEPGAVVFPADGRHMGWEQLGTETGVFVKGQQWDLKALLDGDAAWLERYSGGSLVISRLCPVDYHHFHFPVGGRVVESRWMGRRLYSVSPLSLRAKLGYLWQNRRLATRIETAGHGEVLFIEVGATNVGSIRQHPLPPDGQAIKGQPKGWFEFGGSTVITLFEPGRVRLSADLLACTGKSMELYARCGDRMGTFSQ
jgi:phosphatidylserine decarboxylase